MCELLGMSANVPTDICFSFTGLMLRGGKTGPHKDGWGITFYEGRGFRTFKDPEPSAQSPIAKLVQALPIKSRAVVSHIRQANRGCVSLENTHPFTRELWGRYWTFAHNGQLTGYKKLPTGRHRPVGDTDSEHAFCWIMQELSKSHAGVPTIDELTLTLRELAARIAPHGTFNFLLSNGLALWAHASTHLHYIERRHPFASARLSDEDLSLDFSTCTTPSDRVALIATAPLTCNEQWTAFESGQLKVFVDGVCR